ncbi:hypothetical protein CO660_00235 [Rhizobium sp. L9]|uniref:hypothetical protein n=1 Tax=Rhizobium TaxID=379 RepID=UPI000BE946D2|nr:MULTISPECIES: hypothetical protein [Rhizobium]MBX5131250.1 hypothetical protein [Rhizobium lentis]MBX5137366.1 hypothetical protein [Rhizobium lentis]MBX5149559.1 hypothetical protein [Rhizobium lentis]MBX5175333.1 hypothetical protein [Rhizobium lentis]PDT32300.1 hypothetical protein CO660_00235 [Rhizobium sp. L9]
MSDGILKLIGPLEPKTHRYTRTGKAFPEPYPLAETANVLCKRHNEMFGAAFDVVGIKVAAAVESVFKDTAKGEHVLVNGQDFERFLFQRLAAYYFAKMFSIEGVRDEATLSSDLIEKVMLKRELPDGAGLYLTDPPAHHDPHRAGYEVAMLRASKIDSNVATVSGIRFSIRDIAFVLILDNTIFPVIKLRMHRPKGLLYTNRKTGWRKTLIQFCWPHGMSKSEAEFRSMSRAGQQ